MSTEIDTGTVGIIGAGHIGQAFARLPELLGADPQDAGGPRVLVLSGDSRRSWSRSPELPDDRERG